MEALIQRAAEVLRDGGLVAFPTETVYGLGAVASNPLAVARLFEAKQRPRFNPLIVHVEDLAAAMELATDFPEAAVRLARAFWPGPLTLVVAKNSFVDDAVSAGLPTVGLRVPAHPVAQALLKATGLPIAAPSANRFMTVSPTTAQHVRESLGDAVDYILDGGPCGVGLESTIVDFVDGVPRLLRAGGIPIENIELVVGNCLPPPETAIPLAPGMLKRHYSPHTPLRWDDGTATSGRVGLLTFAPPSDARAFAAIEVLSATGQFDEAAANLYAALRRLDDAGLDLILARRAPDVGLGRAINDRLERAAR